MLYVMQGCWITSEPKPCRMQVRGHSKGPTRGRATPAKIASWIDDRHAPIVTNGRKINAKQPTCYSFGSFSPSRSRDDGDGADPLAPSWPPPGPPGDGKQLAAPRS